MHRSALIVVDSCLDHWPYSCSVHQLRLLLPAPVCLLDNFWTSLPTLIMTPKVCKKPYSEAKPNMHSPAQPQKTNKCYNRHRPLSQRQRLPFLGTLHANASSRLWPGSGPSNAVTAGTLFKFKVHDSIWRHSVD